MSTDPDDDGNKKAGKPKGAASGFKLTEDEDSWPTMGLASPSVSSKPAVRGAWGKKGKTVAWGAPEVLKGEKDKYPVLGDPDPQPIPPAVGTWKLLEKRGGKTTTLEKVGTSAEVAAVPEEKSSAIAGRNLKDEKFQIQLAKTQRAASVARLCTIDENEKSDETPKQTIPEKITVAERLDSKSTLEGWGIPSSPLPKGPEPAPSTTKTTWNWGESCTTNETTEKSTPVEEFCSIKTTPTSATVEKPVATLMNVINAQSSSTSFGGIGVGSQGGGRDRQGGPRGKRRPLPDKKMRPNPDFICNQLESCDVVKSRPTTEEGKVQTKKGKQGKPIDLSTNYYPLESMTNFNLFQYHVDFKPDEERTDVRKKLVRIHETMLGAFIFDGQALYTPHRIAKNPLLLYSMNTYTNQKTQISIRLVAEIAPVDTVFLQVYNIIFRNIMTSMELECMGRFYYDPKRKTTIPARKLEIWPGYITSVRNHEDKILLNLELTHKVVRSDTVLDFINNTKAVMGGSPAASRGRWDYKQETMKHLLGSIVLTRYNKKNYKVDDIKWDVTPIHEFKMRDGKMQSYKDYYKSQYGTIIKDCKQPMLVSLPKKKDYHRGSNQPIYLVPEICQMTGLNDSMRKDMVLMKDLSNHLVLPPAERVKRANAFIARLYADPKIKEELERWNIKVGMKPVKCSGRVVDLDDLVVGGHVSGVTSKIKQDKPGDWTNIFKSKPMLSTVPLRRWILISCPKSEQVTEQLLTTLKSTAKSMNFPMDNPMMKLVLRDTKPTTYSSTIHQLYEQARRNVQMFITLLPNNNAEVYTAIKRKCYCELGVSSQCVLVKTMLTKNPASVASRLAIQMNAKLGGEPWAVEIPLKDLMVVGYDVYHSGNKRAPSVGALVASTATTLAKYFSSTCFHKNKSELSANLCSQMTMALHAYKSANRGKPPARIILYRDGVGDGQLSYIYNTELSQIKEAIRVVYASDIYPPPKFSFIVVTKRIHTRIYGPVEAGPHSSGAEVNPPPGTVVDDVITRPERYDFYLVSQAVNNINATVSPTSYNVLWDEQGLDPDKVQRLTLKLCHLYYNYTGTIAVPAPCQFAHKLAYLTGMSLSNPTKGTLENFLYFL